MVTKKKVITDVYIGLWEKKDISSILEMLHNEFGIDAMYTPGKYSSDTVNIFARSDVVEPEQAGYYAGYIDAFLHYTAKP